MRRPVTYLTLGMMILVAQSVGFGQSGSRNSAPSPSSSPAPVAPSFQSPSLGSPSTTPFPPPSSSGGATFGGTPAPAFGVQGGMPTQGMPNTGMPGMGMSNSGSQQSQSMWEAHDPNSAIMVDHSSWDYFLSRYLRRDAKGLNRVAYRNVTRADYQVLVGYLTYLQTVDVRTLNRSEQLAYWFNLYNARTVLLVVCHRPLLSVRQIKSKFLDLVGPFDDKTLTVLGQHLTLTEVENDIIRAVFKEPRIHYALNCASVGCPNLQPTAWRAANLNARLDAAAYEFINSGRAFKATPFGIKLSSIYKWYADDFGKEDAAVLQHMRRYASPQTSQVLCRYNEVMHYFYDWSLNEVGKGSNLYGIILP